MTTFPVRKAHLIPVNQRPSLTVVVTRAALQANIASGAAAAQASASVAAASADAAEGYKNDAQAIVNSITPEFEAVAAITAEITTVAGIASEVETVAGISSEVQTVAGLETEVSALGPISADITTVAGIASDVTAAAGNEADISTVAGISTDVSAVAAIGEDVSAVAADATDIGTVASNIASVNTVAGADAEISTVAGISGSVTTVAGISGNVTTVAGISANVTSVAGNSSNINAVAGNAANIDAVAANETNINAVAGNEADIDAVAGAATDIATVATNISDVNTVASNIATIGDKLNKDGTEVMTGPLRLTEASAPGTPAAGTVAVYAKTDGKIYIKDDTGTETEVGGGGFSPPQGRLTLTTGSSVTTSDVASATTVYYTPATGATIRLPNGLGGWKIFDDIGELSLALDADSGHTGYHQSGRNFDVFAFDDGGTLRIGTGPSWNAGAVAGSDTARGTGAGSTDIDFSLGVPTNDQAITLRFGSASGNTVAVGANRAVLLGTIRTTANGQTEDSFAKRLVSNAFNAVDRAMRVTTPPGNYAYSTAALRAVNADATQKVEWVHCLAGGLASFEASGKALSNGATSRNVLVSIGLDGATTNPTGARIRIAATTSAIYGYPWTTWEGYLGLGYHSATWLEQGGGTDTQNWSMGFERLTGRILN